jgi:hypothetical protein
MPLLRQSMNIGRKTDQEFLQNPQVHGISFKKRAPRAIKEIKKFAELSMVSRLPNNSVTSKFLRVSLNLSSWALPITKRSLTCLSLSVIGNPRRPS